jgi:hypothetical protein
MVYGLYPFAVAKVWTLYVSICDRGYQRVRNQGAILLIDGAIVTTETEKGVLCHGAEAALRIEQLLAHVCAHHPLRQYRCWLYSASMMPPPSSISPSYSTPDWPGAHTCGADSSICAPSSYICRVAGTGLVR